MLVRSSLRHLWQQRGLTALALMAIGLAVALCVAVWQTNSSAVASFANTSQRLQGSATHLIQGGPQGIPLEWYVEQRRNGTFREASPKIEQRVIVTAEDTGGQQRRERATLLGIDPFAAGELVSDFGTNGIFAADDFNQALLGSPIVFGQADRWPEIVTLWYAGEQHDVRVIPADSSLVYLPDMLVADIATVDRLLGSSGRLTAIDVVLADQDSVTSIQSTLPEGAVLRPGSALRDDLDALTAAFRLNLGALAGLACLVAVYLVISTINLWTVERQPWFAHLRTIGATPFQLVKIIFGEALLLGLLGAIAGFLAGQAVAVVTSALTTQTVQDFYANIPLFAPSGDLISFILALLLGPLLAAVAAIPAAIQCWRLTPRQQSLQRQQSQAPKRVWVGLALCSLGILGLGVLIIVNSSTLLPGWIGMVSIICAITGFAPLCIWGGLLMGRPPMARLAPPSILIGYGWPLRSLLRLGPATAALTLALAASLGVAVMVEAFRSNVTGWLGRVLSADVYISAEGNSISDTGIPLPPTVLELVREVVPDAHLTTIAQTDMVTKGAEAGSTYPWQVTVIESDRAIPFATIGARDVTDVWNDLQAGSILISEPLARQRQLTAGATLQLDASYDGLQHLPVSDLLTDFTPDGGRITMHRQTAENLGWTYNPTGISIRFDEGVPSEQRRLAQAELAQRLADYPLKIQNSEELRATSLELFDRTFTITTVLQVLTAVVAAAGMIVAGVAHQYERRREWAMLRSMGASPQHMRRILISGQVLLGFGAGLAAIPFGVLMAWLLAAVINVRSFGWSLQLTVSPLLCVQTLCIAVITAAIAGWLPARMINKTPLPEAMRWE